MSAAPAVPDSAVDLPGGGAMPLLGFGTWQLTGREAMAATAVALGAGYRHVDTATMYRNEAEVGAAVAASGIDRAQLFLTSKLPGNHADDPDGTLASSLRKLGTSYLDLWLIHWPTGDDRRVWDAFVAARASGAVRDIGVSNFSLDAIDGLSASGVTPAVNQVEWSPLLHDADVLAGHRARGVALEGYSALRGGTLEHPVIVDIARRLDRTPAQVIIAWHLQHAIVVIPKSAREERILSNADVADLELAGDDMAALDALGR